MDAVEGLGKINKADGQWGLELIALLYDASQHKYLLYTGMLWLESCLLFMQLVVSHFLHAFEDHLAGGTPQDRQEH